MNPRGSAADRRAFTGFLIFARDFFSSFVSCILSRHKQPLQKCLETTAHPRAKMRFIFRRYISSFIFHIRSLTRSLISITSCLLRLLIFLRQIFKKEQYFMIQICKVAYRKIYQLKQQILFCWAVISYVITQQIHSFNGTFIVYTLRKICKQF